MVTVTEVGPRLGIAPTCAALGLLTPHDVHYGLAEQRVAARATVLTAAYAAHPERFPGGLPQPPARPTEVWINPPATGSTDIAPDGRSGPEYAEASRYRAGREEHDGFTARSHGHPDYRPPCRAARWRGAADEEGAPGGVSIGGLNF